MVVGLHESTAAAAIPQYIVNGAPQFQGSPAARYILRLENGGNREEIKDLRERERLNLEPRGF